jgi:hypothetical protein
MHRAQNICVLFDLCRKGVEEGAKPISSDAHLGNRPKDADGPLV